MNASSHRPGRVLAGGTTACVKPTSVQRLFDGTYEFLDIKDAEGANIFRADPDFLRINEIVDTAYDANGNSDKTPLIDAGQPTLRAMMQSILGSGVQPPLPPQFSLFRSQPTTPEINHGILMYHPSTIGPPLLNRPAPPFAHLRQACLRQHTGPNIHVLVYAMLAFGAAAAYMPLGTALRPPVNSSWPDGLLPQTSTNKRSAQRIAARLCSQVPRWPRTGTRSTVRYATLQHGVHHTNNFRFEIRFLTGD